MTLGRLIELYKAQRAGKQIMKRTSYHGYYSSRTCIEKIDIMEQDLSMFVDDDYNENVSYSYFIFGDENEYGDKVTENENNDEDAQ